MVLEVSRMNIQALTIRHACFALLAVTTAALAADSDEITSAGIGDDYFSAGGTVELDEPVAGDALLAGGTVESNASIGGDATLAGGEVGVRATIGDDLYAAGGRVEVDALVAGNARIAGGRVRIAPESRIEGGASIAGGTVTAEGEFGRYLSIVGGAVTLGGRIGGDVRVYGDRLTVLPGTRIGGQLRYRTDDEVTLPRDVEIGRGVMRESDDIEGQRVRERGWEPGRIAARVAWVWLAGLFAVGLLLAFGLARFSQRTTQVLTERPWIGMGVGFLVLVCVPAIALALFITLIGIPLALILVMVYVAMLIGAYVIGALYLGDRALARARPGAPATGGWRLLALLAVLIALAIIGAIPVLGDIARSAVLLLGLGGIVLALWGRERVPPPATA
jgi:hypothetical protein